MGNDFFVVGIGASIGKKSALYDVFANIPQQVNAAFVVVLHQKQDHQSEMKFLLSRHTRYPIYMIRDGEEIKPESIYLIPENTTVTVMDGRLSLKARHVDSGQNTFDEFLVSLAEDMKQRAIGIILSGMGTDGKSGAKAIVEYGGIVMLEDPGAPESHSMPTSLVENDLPSYVVPAMSMGMHLNEYLNSREQKNEFPAEG